MPQLQPINATLLGSDADPIALTNLQQALLLLVEHQVIAPVDPAPSSTELADIASDVGFELQTPVYGRGTGRAVCWFQRQQELARAASDGPLHHLCGGMDNETAERINQHLAGLGALDGTGAPGYEISGRVEHADRGPAAGITVRVLRHDGRSDLLGQALSGDDGRYRVWFAAWEPPILIAAAFDNAGERVATSRVVESGAISGWRYAGRPDMPFEASAKDLANPTFLLELAGRALARQYPGNGVGGTDAEGWGAAELDTIGVGKAYDRSKRYQEEAYHAMRGREQMLIDALGGASLQNTSLAKDMLLDEDGLFREMAGRTHGNTDRAIGLDNPCGPYFHWAAVRSFIEELWTYSGDIKSPPVRCAAPPNSSVFR